MAMLFITHDLGIVRKFADRVCVMTDGQDRRNRTNSEESSPIRSMTTPSTCSPPNPRASRPAQDNAPEVMQARRHQGLVPDQAGASAQDRGSREGGGRAVDFPCAQARRSASSASPAPARRRWGWR
jgi:ABC-type microcin C transport system duplicated ATPase subunit YejF